MSKREVTPEDGLGLADAIELLRDELLKARAAGGEADIQLPMDSMTVQLRVAATRSRDGKAGFSVPIVNVALGGGRLGAGDHADGDCGVWRAGRPRGQSGEDCPRR